MFASPWLLGLLPFVTLLLLWRWRSAPPPPSLAVATAEPFEAAARATGRGWRERLLWLPGVLRALALVLLVVALARPRQGLALELIPEEGIDVVVALDISSSMSERVVSPATGRVDDRSRLEAAKDVIHDFISSLQGDRVGLVIFQSQSLALSPLTLDHAAVERAVRSTRPGLLVDGTAIGLGLGESLNLLRDSEARSRIVVLLTDGQNNTGEIEPLSAAELARALGVRVYTIGVLGSPGQTLDVDVATLRRIAERTDAQYFDAATTDDLAEAYDTISKLERSIVGERRFSTFRELGPLLAGGALALLALEVVLRSTVLRRYP